MFCRSKRGSTTGQALGNYVTPNQLVVGTKSNPMGLAGALRHAIQSAGVDL